MIFWLWLFIISGAGILMLVGAEALREKHHFALPWHAKRQEFEKKLGAAEEGVKSFLEKVHGGMLLTMLHSGIERMKQLFFKQRHAVREKAAALSRKMIAGNEESEKKPSDFLSNVASLKDRFREK